MKIIKVIMKNFMSHINTEIDLNEFFVIKGPNDSGKSTILHAIRWVFLNQPKGDLIINNKHDECSVKIIYEIYGNIHNLEKIRKGSNTEFIFDEKQYYKSDFPIDAINPYESILFGEHKINFNFTFQHDDYFMLNNTSEINNAIINHMQNVDPIIKEVIKDIRESKKNHEILNSLIKINEIKLELLKENKEIENKLINNIEELNKKISSLEEYVKVLKILDNYNINKIETNIIEDSDIINYKDLEYYILYTIEIIKHKEINTVDYELLSNYNLETLKLNIIKDIDFINTEELINMHNEIIKYQKMSIENKEKIKNLKEELSKFEVCPTCNRPF